MLLDTYNALTPLFRLGTCIFLHHGRAPDNKLQQQAQA